MSDRTGLDGSNEAVDLDAIEARATAAAAMGLRFLTERYIPDGEINRYNMDVEQLAEDDVLALVAAVRTLRAENRALIKDRAANEKANIASRRSICEQSDRFKSERDSLAARLAEVEAERDAARETIERLSHWPRQTAALAVAEAQLAAVRELAEQWRNVTPAGFYPEASAAANATENCGDALMDLLDEAAAVPGLLETHSKPELSSSGEPSPTKPTRCSDDALNCDACFPPSALPVSVTQPSCYIDDCDRPASYIVHSHPDDVRLCDGHRSLHPVEPHETLCAGASCSICSPVTQQEER